MCFWGLVFNMGEQANWQSRVISEDLAKPETAILLVSVEDTVYEGSIPSSPTKLSAVLRPRNMYPQFSRQNTALLRRVSEVRVLSGTPI